MKNIYLLVLIMALACVIACGSSSISNMELVGSYNAQSVTDCPIEWSATSSGGVVTVTSTGETNKFALTSSNTTLGYITYDLVNCTMETFTGLNNCSCSVALSPTITNTIISGSCNVTIYSNCLFEYVKQ